MTERGHDIGMVCYPQFAEQGEDVCFFPCFQALLIVIGARKGFPPVTAGHRLFLPSSEVLGIGCSQDCGF